MSVTQAQWAVWLATGAAVSVLFSNAVSQILLGAAFAFLLWSHRKLRFPPILLPFAVFLLGTLIALALSPDPRSGLPQIKKFYVYLIIPVVYTALRNARDVLNIFLIQTAIATASGAWSFVQFLQKRHEALSHHWNFYSHYVANRATGFMSHWMTFSAEMMGVGLMLGALLLFGAVRQHRAILWAALAIIAGALTIAWTRSVWLAAAIGTVYLVAVSRPKLLFAIPVAAVVLWPVMPRSVRERVVSVYHPHGRADSNEHRVITRRTGIEMIRKHPWFGLGPDMPGRQFQSYIPADIPRPLPEGFYGHLHNVYLQYAADRGIPTMLALLWVIGKAMSDFARELFRTTREDRLRRAVLHGAMAVSIAMLAEGFFEYNLGDSEVLTVFLVALACAYVVIRREPLKA